MGDKKMEEKNHARTHLALTVTGNVISIRAT